MKKSTIRYLIIPFSVLFFSIIFLSFIPQQNLAFGCTYDSDCPPVGGTNKCCGGNVCNDYQYYFCNYLVDPPGCAPDFTVPNYSHIENCPYGCSNGACNPPANCSASYGTDGSNGAQGYDCSPASAGSCASNACVGYPMRCDNGAWVNDNPYGQCTTACNNCTHSTCDGTTYANPCTTSDGKNGIQTCNGKNSRYDAGCNTDCTTCEARYKCSGISCSDASDGTFASCAAANCDPSCTYSTWGNWYNTSCCASGLMGERHDRTKTGGGAGCTATSETRCIKADASCTSTAKYRCSGTSCIRDDVNGIFPDCVNRCTGVTGTISASPKPCNVTSGSSCTSNISWTTSPPTSAALVYYLDSNSPGVLAYFAAGASSPGLPATIYSIPSGRTYTFNLYKDSNFGINFANYIASVTVTASMSPVTLSGRVTNATTGAPIPGVDINSGAGNNPCGDLYHQPTMVTDNNGYYYAYNVPTGAFFCLRPPALGTYSGPVINDPAHPTYGSYECQTAGANNGAVFCGPQFLPVTDLAVDNTYNFTYTPIAALSATCTASPATVNVGGTVTYTANASGGVGSYHFSWSGTDIPSPVNTDLEPLFSNPYSLSGLKDTYLTVTDSQVPPQTTTSLCTPQVAVTVAITPWLQIIGDIHSNTGITASGGP